MADSWPRRTLCFATVCSDVARFLATTHNKSPRAFGTVWLVQYGANVPANPWNDVEFTVTGVLRKRHSAQFGIACIKIVPVGRRLPCFHRFSWTRLQLCCSVQDRMKMCLISNEGLFSNKEPLEKREPDPARHARPKSAQPSFQLAGALRGSCVPCRAVKCPENAIPATRSLRREIFVQPRQNNAVMQARFRGAQICFCDCVLRTDRVVRWCGLTIPGTSEYRQHVVTLVLPTIRKERRR